MWAAGIPNIGIVIGQDQIFSAAVPSVVDGGLRVGCISTHGLPWTEMDQTGDLGYRKTHVSPRLPRNGILPQPSLGRVVE